MQKVDAKFITENVKASQELISEAMNQAQLVEQGKEWQVIETLKDTLLEVEQKLKDMQAVVNKYE